MTDIQVDELRGKLLTAFIEACQSMDPTPTTVLNLFKVVLKEIQVGKLCGEVKKEIATQEMLLS